MVPAMFVVARSSGLQRYCHSAHWYLHRQWFNQVTVYGTNIKQFITFEIRNDAVYESGVTVISLDLNDHLAIVFDFIEVFFQYPLYGSDIDLQYMLIFIQIDIIAACMAYIESE